MKALLARSALIVAAIVVSVAAQAETRLQQIIGAGVIRVGTTGDYKPFTYLNPQTGTFEGIDIDMAQALGKGLGVKVEFVKTSWPTLGADFAAGKFDIAVGGVSITTDRAKVGYFSIPILQDGKAAIAKVFHDYVAGSKKTNIVPEDLRVQQRGDIAIVTFNVHNPSAVSRRTFVWRRDARGWRIGHMHASNK